MMILGHNRRFAILDDCDYATHFSIYYETLYYGEHNLWTVWCISSFSRMAYRTGIKQTVRVA